MAIELLRAGTLPKTPGLDNLLKGELRQQGVSVNANVFDLLKPGSQLQKRVNLKNTSMASRI